MTGGDLGSRARLKPGSHLWWFPAEVNTTILQNSAWFWARNKQPRTVTQLVDIFYTSVGRNGNLILNLSPDKRGLVPDNQLDALSRWRRSSTKPSPPTWPRAAKSLLTPPTPRTPVARTRWKSRHLVGSRARPDQRHGDARRCRRRSRSTSFRCRKRWIIAANESKPLPSKRGTASAWTAPEHVASDSTHDGRPSPAHPIEIARDHRPGAHPHHRFAPRTDAGRNRAFQAIRRRPCRRPFPIASTNGLVTLNNSAGCQMVYTVDGTAPTTNSPVYNSPIALPSGGTVQAASLMPNGQLGILASKSFAGLLPVGWKVVSVDSQETAGADNSAANAIDGNASTFWHTRWNDDLALPHHLTIDMGIRIASADSPIFRARTATPTAPSKTTVLKRARMALTGRRTSFPAHSPTFGTIRRSRKSPLLRSTPGSFASRPCKEVTEHGWTSAAEISVLPAGGSGD